MTRYARWEDTHCLFVMRERLVGFSLLGQTVCKEIMALCDHAGSIESAANASRRWTIASSVLPCWMQRWARL